MKRLSFDVDDDTYKKLKDRWVELLEEFEDTPQSFPFNQFLSERLEDSFLTEEEEEAQQAAILKVVAENDDKGVTPRQLLDMADDEITH